MVLRFVSRLARGRTAVRPYTRNLGQSAERKLGRSESGRYKFERPLQGRSAVIQRCELAVGQVAGADQRAAFNVSETHGLSHLFPVLKLLGGIVAGHR